MTPLTRTSAAVLWSVATLASAQTQYPEKVGPPESMAALGDSITRGVNPSPAPFGTRPHLSWSTGNDGGITSHYTQLDALGDAPTAYNLSVSGADMSDIGAQVTNAISSRPEYITVLMGANDACADSEAEMTSVETFRSQFASAMDSLSAALPDTRIFVASIPDLYVLWEVLHTNSAAVDVWNGVNLCQSMLENPTSLEAADEDRRKRVQDRVIAYNAQLREVCAQYLHCRYDDGGVFSRPFTAADVSTYDYFHPSRQGQIRLGTETWPSTFDFTDEIAPRTQLSIADGGTDDLVTLTASDNVGVRGIEYRFEEDARWTRYQQTVTVPDGEWLTYRAVDVNGNIEGSKSYKRGEPLPDAGEPFDGGVTDAGTADAGGGGGGGILVPGGGGGGNPSDPAGCGCGAGGALPTALFALLALVRVRRRQQ